MTAELGGIRHLIWDAGYGFDQNEREWLPKAHHDAFFRDFLLRG